MATGPEVKVTLTAEDTGVAAAIKELGSNLKNLKKTQDTTAKSSLNLSQAFQGLAAGAIAYKILAFGKSVFEAGVQIARTAQITGASAQTLSVFHKAAGDMGIGVDVVDRSLVRMSRSILAFQQGSPLVIKAFQQLGISAKDLAGLNTDQKLKLITDRLGQMREGTTRAALAQQLLGRGGAEMLPVMQALAGNGFAKVTAEAKKMGLLLDDQTLTAMRGAQKAMADLHDEAEGAATQFEVGLIPALTDAANAMVHSINGAGVNGFRKLGEEAGSVIKGIVYGWTIIGANITATGADIVAFWDHAMSRIGHASKQVADDITLNFKGADEEIQAMQQGDKDYAQQKAEIERQLNRTKDQANLDVYGGAATAPLTQLKGTKPEAQTNDPAEANAVRQAQSRLALLRTHLDDELAIYRAHEKDRLQSEKTSYDESKISFAEYFAARRTELVADTAEELTTLQNELKAEQLALAHNSSEAKKLGDATPGGRAFESAKAANLKTIEELHAKISKAQIDGETKLSALEDQRFQKEKQNEKTRLGFEEQMLTAEGKTFQVEIAKIKEEAAEYAKAGGSAADVAAFTKQKTSQATFEQAAGDSRTGMQQFEIQKKTIEIRAKSGKLGKLAEEREINQLIAQRIPLLQQQAQAELAAARASGNMDDIQKAQNQVQAVQNLKVQTTSLAQQMRGPITQSFTGFFETVGRGTQTVQRSFENLAGGIIAALQKVLMQKLMEKILGTDSSSSGGSGGGGGFGGLLGGLLGAFSGHAEGGLIRGRGGPRSDSIPAMLSSGEYVVNAAAVAAFGAHNLEAINRGLRIESIRNLGIPRFAEGGLVGPGSSGEASNIHLAVGLEQGLVLKHLSSKAAGRVMLQHLVNNPKTASKAMSRGT